MLANFIEHTTILAPVKHNFHFTVIQSAERNRILLIHRIQNVFHRERKRHALRFVVENRSAPNLLYLVAVHRFALLAAFGDDCGNLLVLFRKFFILFGFGNTSAVFQHFVQLIFNDRRLRFFHRFLLDFFGRQRLFAFALFRRRLMVFEKSGILVFEFIIYVLHINNQIINIQHLAQVLQIFHLRSVAFERHHGRQLFNEFLRAVQHPLHVGCLLIFFVAVLFDECADRSKHVFRTRRRQRRARHVRRFFFVNFVKHFLNVCRRQALVGTQAVHHISARVGKAVHTRHNRAKIHTAAVDGVAKRRYVKPDIHPRKAVQSARNSIHRRDGQSIEHFFEFLLEYLFIRCNKEFGKGFQILFIGLVVFHRQAVLFLELL